jgi:glycosyltransferase involved in cell wall biosynthesis
MSKIILLLRSIRNSIQSFILILAEIISINVRNSLPKRQFIIVGDNFANTLFNLKKVLTDSYVVNFSEVHFYVNNNYDFFLSKNKIFEIFYNPLLLYKLSKSSDIFIYVGKNGFCKNRESDFKFLKRKNKKIIIMFVGSDIRSPKKLKEYLKENDLDSFINYIPPSSFQSEEYIRKTAEVAEKYANFIITAKIDQISYFTKKTYPFLYYIDQFEFNNINLKKFDHPSKLKILHVPTSPIFKGTPLVNAAIKKLKTEGYDFEYIEARNIEHTEFIQMMKTSHIVLNEFYCFVPGVTSVEAMFSYCTVLTSANPDIEEFPEDPNNAWIITGYWEIYDKLKFCLENPGELEGYAKRGYAYAMRNYNLEAARRQFKSYCDSAGITLNE